MKRMIICLVAIFTLMMASAQTVTYVRTKMLCNGQVQENAGMDGIRTNFVFSGDRLTGPPSMFGFKYSHTDGNGSKIYYAVGKDIVYGTEWLNKDSYIVVEPGGEYLNYIWGPSNSRYTEVYKKYVPPTPGRVIH